MDNYTSQPVLSEATGAHIVFKADSIVPTHGQSYFINLDSLSFPSTENPDEEVITYFVKQFSKDPEMPLVVFTAHDDGEFKFTKELDAELVTAARRVGLTRINAYYADYPCGLFELIFS